jgi:hypothetical protein
MGNERTDPYSPIYTFAASCKESSYDSDRTFFLLTRPSGYLLFDVPDEPHAGLQFSPVRTTPEPDGQRPGSTHHLYQVIPVSIPMVVEPVPHDHDVQLEKALLAREHARVDAWQRKNRQALDALLDDNFIEINALGRFGKKDVLKILLDAITLEEFSIEKPRFIALGSDVILLTYRCSETIIMGGDREEISAHVVAVYVMRNNQWRLLHWQITPFIGCR